VRADRVRLKQALLNLLSNAVKYNRPGGEVRLTAQPVDGDRLQLRVADTGPGIPEGRVTELFQPFNRLGAELSGVEGTGIGLVITRRIVEMMGGSIGVESRVGEGSAFWIELPLDTRPDRLLTAAGRVAAGTATTGATCSVLYIEDNPANLKLVSQLLARRPNVRMLSAHTPMLGLDLADANRPDLVLLDINMPDLNGYDVLAKLRAHAWARDLPVIAITANALPRDIERGRAAGFSEYLTKPLDLDRFLAAIDRFLPGARGGAGSP
jgi:CheY-like chemotaxis protein